MAERIKLLPRYLINLGLFTGFYVFVQVELLSLSRIGIPGYAQAIFLRPESSDRLVFREIFLFRIYNFPLSVLPKVIVDGGANIGLSTIYFAHRFKDANIYAVEPEGSNLEQLRKNTKSYSNVKIIAAALWHSDGLLKIKKKDESKWAFSVEVCGDDEADALRGLSISTLLNETNCQRIDLLKLDIEGAEKELFQTGYEDWLCKVKTLVIELHDWMKPGCSTSFFGAISKYQVSVSIYEGMLVTTNLDVK